MYFYYYLYTKPRGRCYWLMLNLTQEVKRLSTKKNLFQTYSLVGFSGGETFQYFIRWLLFWLFVVCFIYNVSDYVDTKTHG